MFLKPVIKTCKKLFFIRIQGPGNVTWASFQQWLMNKETITTHSSKEQHGSVPWNQQPPLRLEQQNGIRYSKYEVAFCNKHNYNIIYCPFMRINEKKDKWSKYDE